MGEGDEKEIEKNVSDIFFRIRLGRFAGPCSGEAAFSSLRKDDDGNRAFVLL